MPDLSALPDGMKIFVDTNIFHYHLEGKSMSCTNFIIRIAKREVEAYVNTQVLSDLLHKLMITKAIAKGCMTSTNPEQLKKYFKNHPDTPNPLTNYQKQFEEIMRLRLHVLPINKRLLISTKLERQTHGFMVGDSLHLGCMNRYKEKRVLMPIQDIATQDGDFDEIPELTVWKPQDMKRK